MASENLDQFVALFKTGGVIERMASASQDPPAAALPSPEEIPGLVKLAEQGDEVALLVCGLHGEFDGDSPDEFLLAIKTASDAVGGLLAGYDKQGRDVMTGWSSPSPAKADPNRYSKLVDQAGVVGQLWPGTIAGIPNAPGPLASMLVLGTLGAGAGNLAGRFLARSELVDRERTLNRTTALGGLLGLLPGAAIVGANAAAGRPLLSNKLLATPRKHAMIDPVLFSRPDLIPIERMQQMIWEDPHVASRLPPQVAAAASALVEGASRQQPRSLPFVSPADIARMAVGMGSGYTSGLLVGKALGGLFGVSDTAQQVLRQSGAAAGLIRTFVPLAFGA